MNKKNKLKVSSILKKIRKNENLSLSQMSKFLKVTPASISHYESGRAIPSFKVLSIYREQFNLDLNALIDIKEAG